MLKQDDVSPREGDPDCLAQQRQPTNLCDSASSLPPSPQTTPTLVMTESLTANIREKVEKQSEREEKSEGEEEQEMERTPQGVGKKAEPGGIGKEAEPGGGRVEVEPERGGIEAEPVESDPKKEETINDGVEKVSHTELDKGAEEQEEEQEEEVNETVDALELEEELQRPEDAMLDLLAKRIQVEEVRKYTIYTTHTHISSAVCDVTVMSSG